MNKLLFRCCLNKFLYLCLAEAANSWCAVLANVDSAGQKLTEPCATAKTCGLAIRRKEPRARKDAKELEVFGSYRWEFWIGTWQRTFLSPRKKGFSAVGANREADALQSTIVESVKQAWQLPGQSLCFFSCCLLSCVSKFLSTSQKLSFFCRGLSLAM